MAENLKSVLTRVRHRRCGAPARTTKRRLRSAYGVLLVLAGCNGDVIAPTGDAGVARGAAREMTNDASSGRGASGSEAGPCQTNADCPSGSTCLFEIGGGCPGTGACYAQYDDSSCLLLETLCGCDGVPVCVSACPRAAGMDVNATTVPTTGSQSCITPDASGTCSG